MHFTDYDLGLAVSVIFWFFHFFNKYSNARHHALEVGSRGHLGERREEERSFSKCEEESEFRLSEILYL